MQIRLAGAADRERLIALREVAGWHAELVDGWLADCATGRRLLWIAERDGVDVAMVALLLTSDDPELADGTSRACMTSLVVVDSERRRGVARALTELVEAEARRRALATLTLYTRITNEGAIRLYQSLGYSSWKQITFDWGEAICLRKPLAADDSRSPAAVETAGERRLPSCKES